MLWKEGSYQSPYDTFSSKEQLNSPSGQYLTDDRMDSISKIVNDDDRWQWSQGRGVTGGRNKNLERPENPITTQVQQLIMDKDKNYNK